MANLDLPEDVRLSLAKARDRLNLDPFASPLEVIKQLAALGQSASIAETIELPEPPPPSMRRQAPKRKGAWPPSKAWVIGAQPIDPGANQADQFGNAMRALAQLNPHFLSKFARHCESQAGESGRMWVSQNRDLLYPGKPKLIKSQSREIPDFPGWWFGTNYSQEKKREIIQLACRIEGVAFREISSNVFEVPSTMEATDAGQPPSLIMTTHRDFYTNCWLKAFYSQGGTLARQKGVEDLVFNQIKWILRPKDYELIPSGNPNYKSDIRWRKDVEWSHHHMVKRGWIKSVSRGVWTLTPTGVIEAEKVIGQK